MLVILSGSVAHSQKAASPATAACGFILNVPKNHQTEANKGCEKGYGCHENVPQYLQSTARTLTPSLQRVTFDTHLIFYP